MRTLTLLALLLASTFTKAQFKADNAELFVEINDPGKYEVSVNDDYASARLGRARFYDVNPGLAHLTISLAGKTVLRKEVDLRPGLRTIVTYSRRDGLRTFSQLDIYRNHRYALDNWSGNLDVHDDRPGDGRPYATRPMSQTDFDALLRALTAEAFDDGKEKVLAIALRDNTVSVSQLTQLLGKFTFDDRRLSVAINSYSSVYDRDRFFQLRSLFNTFNRDKFDEFMLKNKS